LDIEPNIPHVQLLHLRCFSSTQHNLDEYGSPSLVPHSIVTFVYGNIRSVITSSLSRSTRIYLPRYVFAASYSSAYPLKLIFNTTVTSASSGKRSFCSKGFFSNMNPSLWNAVPWIDILVQVLYRVQRSLQVQGYNHTILRSYLRSLLQLRGDN
jgi:hypothetical protein